MRSVRNRTDVLNFYNLFYVHNVYTVEFFA